VLKYEKYVRKNIVLTTQYTSNKYFIDVLIKGEGNITVPIYIVIDI